MLLPFALLVGLLAASLTPITTAASSADPLAGAELVPLCTLPARQRARLVPRTHGGTPISETEPNDSASQSNALAFGTGGGASDVEVAGTLSPPAPAVLVVAEDDGAIPLANSTGLLINQNGRASGVIGDGPHGDSSGDYDFYRVSARAGERISVDVDAEILASPLDSYAGIYNSAGDLIASNDDTGASADSSLAIFASAEDDYFIVVRGFGAGFQSDPFTSASGPGRGSTGYYEVEIEVGDAASDVFHFVLAAGDVVAANLTGSAARLVVHGPAGAEVVGSAQDVTSIYPISSPLLGGGTAALSWVAAMPGTYTITANGGVGPYSLQLRAFRPALQQRSLGARQTLYLDFDGASVDGAKFGGAGVRMLSPLAAFLAGWGLTVAEEDAVIDAIVARVQQDFSAVAAGGANGDFAVSGVAGEFAIEIRNSRDDGPLWGQPNLTRVIVGGTIAELGINTIGVSEAIDVGNFATEESAVVLLDHLSDPNTSNPRSLNRFPIDPPHSIVDVIGAAVGGAVSHEAGHLFGSFHTDRLNQQPCVMDVGGDIGDLLGVGEDGIFGSDDDVEVRFVADTYAPSEGFTGTEDTRNVNAFGLSTGTGPVFDTPTPTATATATDPGEPPMATATATLAPSATPTPALPASTPTRTISPTPPLPGTCASLPRGDCRTPRDSGFGLRLKAGSSERSRFKWKWLQGKGEREDWGAPQSSTAYDVCLYDGTGLRLTLTVAAGGNCPPGRPCWQSSRHGYTFRDRGRSQYGMEKISLRAGKGRISAKLSGRGAAMPLPALPLYVPLTVQLVSSEGRCWSATYTKLKGNNLDTIQARKIPPPF